MICHARKCINFCFVSGGRVLSFVASLGSIGAGALKSIKHDDYKKLPDNKKLAPDTDYYFELA